MVEIKIIKSLDEFLSKVDRLYEVIEKERKKRIDEYHALGRRVPRRIKFEELNLSAFRTDMLGIHKTLLWGGHNPNLKDYEQKAKIVAIAGICELVKDEYIHSFWDMYKKYFDAGANYTVYEWIWEKAFKKEGIELVQTFRREFVQSLVLESGVPKNRARDLISFFVLFWRYLRHFDDIEKLISEINEFKINIDNIPLVDRAELRNLCTNAIEFSRAFALVVSKLSKVFSFIESSEEIFLHDLDGYAEYIYKGCGVDPFEILRDKDQLKNLYSRILGLVTPEKLRRILKTQSPGARIIAPSGDNLRVDQYNRLMFGEHNLRGTRFSCVPSLAYTVAELNSLPYNEIQRYSKSILLKSKSMITVIVNSQDRPDLVRPFYVDEGGNQVFKGYIFYIQLQSAMSVNISTEDNKVFEFIRESDGVYCTPYLKYFYKRGSHNLALFIPSFRIKCEELRGEKISLYTDLDNNPIADINLDQEGLGIASELNYFIKLPSPRKIRIYALQTDLLTPLLINGKSVEFQVEMQQAMLFSPFTRMQFPVRSRNDAVTIGGKTFVFFLDESAKSEVLDFNNLNTASEKKYGKYRVFVLKWVDFSKSCKIHTDSAHWEFEHCLDIRLYLHKKNKEDGDFVVFNKKQEMCPEDFELTICPLPSDEIYNELQWSIIVNNGIPYQLKVRQGPKGNRDGNCIRFSGEDTARLLEPVWDAKTNGNAAIEIFLSNAEMIFGSVKFWLFPNLKIDAPSVLLDNQEVALRVVLNPWEDQKLVSMKDQRGRSKALLSINFQNGLWEVVRREYSGTFAIEEFGTSLNFKWVPAVHGVRFGSRNTGETIIPSGIMKNDLEGLDIILVGDSKESPVVTVNGKNHELVFSLTGSILSAPLIQLLPVLDRNENNVIVKTGDGIIEHFIISSTVIVKNITVEEHLINNSVMGIISYDGPAGSGLYFVVIACSKSHEQKEITKFDINCDGKVHIDYDFSIPLDKSTTESNEYCILKLLLLKDVNDSSVFHEYGESWNISLGFEREDQDYEYLKSKAIAFSQADKYFAAKRFLELAKIIAPNSEKEWIDDFMINLEAQLFYLQINSIASQTARVLKKEYLIS